MPTSSLLAPPFNLPWGSSIYVTITATNLYGTSDVSNQGNGAVILTIPDAPLNLANNAGLTSAQQTGLTWSQGLSNGGTPVISYSLFFDQGMTDG